MLKSKQEIFTFKTEPKYLRYKPKKKILRDALRFRPKKIFALYFEVQT